MFTDEVHAEVLGRASPLSTATLAQDGLWNDENNENDAGSIGARTIDDVERTIRDAGFVPVRRNMR